MLSLPDRPVASRYARALFAAASGQAAVESVRGELIRLRDALNASPDLDDALCRPQVLPTVKREILRQAFGAVSPLTDRFLGVLLEKKRWDALREILPIYERLADAAERILSVQADTALPWTEEEIDRVRRALEKRWGGSVVLRANVREDLLGGLVLRVGDQVWDNSLKGQLERLREVWLAGTSR